VTCAVAYIGALVVGPAPLAYVPSALIGGLLLFIGISFLYEWVVEGRARLPRSEYAVVLLIVVTVASQGYVLYFPNPSDCLPMQD
jgi:SulP family sulfate permease